MRKPRVLYFYPAKSSFVQKDAMMMAAEFEVLEFEFTVRSKPLLVFVMLRQFFFLLVNSRNARLSVVQFGGYQSLLPALFHKLLGLPCLIIAGGTDCVAYPSIGYGAFANKRMRWFLFKSYKWATHISPVHDSLWKSTNTYYVSDLTEQGIKSFIPNLATPHTVIANGYDSNSWSAYGERDFNLLVTVAAGLDEKRRRKLKGIDLITAMAANFPDKQFMIIGGMGHFKTDLPNVIVYGNMEQGELKNCFRRAGFYLQLSISEGFPNALCEAMLCGCIPIVSNVAAMPMIIGDSGFILEKYDAELLGQIIMLTENNDLHALSFKARERIKTEFPEVRRKIELTQLMNSLIVKASLHEINQL